MCFIKEKIKKMKKTHKAYIKKRWSDNYSCYAYYIETDDKDINEKCRWDSGYTVSSKKNKGPVTTADDHIHYFFSENEAADWYIKHIVEDGRIVRVIEVKENYEIKNEEANG